MRRYLSTNDSNSSAPRRLPGFTLIELMVVVAIIVILATVSIPAVKSLTQGNNQKQAANLLTALIANARGIAITSHTPAGLVVYEDPSSRSQTAVQLLTCSSVTFGSGSVPKMYFTRAGGTAPQMLPRGIKVATFANSGNTFNTGEVASPNARVIIFDENGQLIMRNSLFRDSTLTDASSAAWNFLPINGTGSNAAPGFVLYDAAEFQAAIDSGKVTANTASTYAPWLEQHADILLLNPYTGNVIR